MPLLRPLLKCLPRPAVVIGFLLLSFAASGLAAQKLESFSFPEDGFRASFPTQPQMQKLTQATKSGGIIVMHSYCVPSGNATLCVVVILNGVTATGLAPQMLLELTKQGILTGNGNHKVSTGATDFEGHTEETVEAENDKVHTSARLYMVDDLIYQTIVTAPIEDKSVDAERFFNSFKLIKRKD